MIKPRRMRWTWHVEGMGEKRNAYGLLVEKPEGKRRLEEPRRRWEAYNKKDFRNAGWEY
jgi:hypothetical protein